MPPVFMERILGAPPGAVRQQECRGEQTWPCTYAQSFPVGAGLTLERERPRQAHAFAAINFAFSQINVTHQIASFH